MTKGSTENSIVGVSITKLKQIKDERGSVMHMMRNDKEPFKQFGEVYFSTLNPGVTKGWKKHLAMTQHFTVPYGSIKIVLVDTRDDSPTKNNILEVTISPANYILLTIPPLITYAFRNESEEISFLANCTDIVHDPNESMAMPLDSPDIPYSWHKD
ncbi:MAG: dTDP-4-dehydrorhamnose 3,5-epimerase family protein [Planctomycetes bacterium]|nr:dTDP-4-dehydrorhamnose 3,5-epimerase family protein [Planctomycetota bacterium]